MPSIEGWVQGNGMLLLTHHQCSLHCTSRNGHCKTLLAFWKEYI